MEWMPKLTDDTVYDRIPEGGCYVPTRLLRSLERDGYRVGLPYLDQAVERLANQGKIKVVSRTLIRKEPLLVRKI